MIASRHLDVLAAGVRCGPLPAVIGPYLSASNAAVGAVVTKVDDQVIDGSDALGAAVLSHAPADAVSVDYVAPTGDTRSAHVTLCADAGQQSSVLGFFHSRGGVG